MWVVNLLSAGTDQERKMKIGQLVKFKIQTIHGMGKAAGIVKRILPDGRIEIKAQLGGYYILELDQLIQ